MGFLQDFKFEFGELADKLQLKNVTVNREKKTATVTFLYPSNIGEISLQQRKDVETWLEKKLNLEELTIKTKFLKVYLEEKLIRKTLYSFVEERFKLVSTYLSADDFRIAITPIDVKISVTLSSRLFRFFAENNVQSEIAAHLKANFLCEFSVFAEEDASIVDEIDLSQVEIKATYKVTPRYEIEVVKPIVGKVEVQFPQLISSIKTPRLNVTLAGFLQKPERIDYVRKTGAKAGQQATRFTFTLQDSSGKIGAVHFASKSSISVMDALEEGMFVVGTGDVKLNYMNRLSFQVKKLALATIVNDEMLQKLNKKEKERGVVHIEKIETLMQDDIFAVEHKYDERIMNNSIVVFDFETTGLDTSSAEITEIGAVKIEKGVLTEKLYSFVKPSVSISAEVVKLTGIDDEMVKDAPSVEPVIRDFYDFSRGCILCGHNAVDFDVPILLREAEKLGLNFDNEVIDTMLIARGKHLKTSKFNLGAVLKALGLHNEGAHRAWNDAYATAQALLKMSEI